jgi:hypothetical protein
MAKSSVIIAPITFVVVIICALLNNIFCVCSPIAAVVLGLAAGGLCVYFEKPADAEKAAVRGGIAGAISGLVALVAQTISETVALVILSAGKTPVACLPGLCEQASAPTSQAAYIASSFFSSCFCGLMLLAIMAGLGALGGILWHRYGNKAKSIPLPSIGIQPPVNG